jgi:aminoglycoside phosphotransferase (APT) family kinase protein
VGSDAYTLFEWYEGRVLNESLARRLIDSQFPRWAYLPISAVDLDGWDNRSFRLGAQLVLWGAESRCGRSLAVARAMRRRDPDVLGVDPAVSLRSTSSA